VRVKDRITGDLKGRSPFSEFHIPSLLEKERGTKGERLINN
jgi:hypothetical protein